MEENPFGTSISKLFRARVEFRHFVEQVTSQHATEEVFAFHKFPRDDDALQFNFVGRRAAETGPMLLYRLAPTGDVVTLIFPGKSDVHKAGEDCIALRASRCTSYQLRMRLARDLRDLAAYGHVTNPDGRPTWRETLRIKWLRWTRGLSVGGAGGKSSAAADVGQELALLALRPTATAVGATIGRSLVAAAVVALLAWLGYWAAGN
jgi:hypothetical protein